MPDEGTTDDTSTEEGGTEEDPADDEADSEEDTSGEETEENTGDTSEEEFSDSDAGEAVAAEESAEESEDENEDDSTDADSDDTHDHSSWTKIDTTTTSITSSGSYYLDTDVETTLTISGESTEVVIDLNGHTLDGNSQGSVITVSDGASLTIMDCTAETVELNAAPSQTELADAYETDDDNNTVFVGTTVNNNDGTWTTYYAKADADDASVDENGDVTVVYTYYTYTSGAITGGTGTSALDRENSASYTNNIYNAYYGGGIYVSDGSLSIDDGTVTGNSIGNTTTSIYGIGIYVNGDFDMTGGVISNNKCTNSHWGGTRKSGDTGSGYVYYHYSGGGLCVYGSFSMVDSIVLENVVGKNTGINTIGTSDTGSSGNKHASRGAGISVTLGDDDSFTMSECVLTGNYTTAMDSSGVSYGGGVFVTYSGSDTCTVTIKDTCVRYNYTTYGGIAVYGNGINLDIDDSVICDNNTKGNGQFSKSGNGGGGGIYVDAASGTDCNFTIDDCYIFDNECAGSCGGGILLYNKAKMTMSNCVVSGNKAYSGGGGIGMYHSGTAATISNSQILNNLAARNGGGIITADSSSLTLNNVTVSGNTVDANSTGRGGGGIGVHGGTLIMTDSVVTENSTLATSYATNGGGIFISSDGGTATISNSTVSDNSTTGSGGGIYVTTGTLNIESGTISENSASTGTGAGIYVAAGTLNMSGGTIEDHTATSGAGIYSLVGTLNLTGGTITENTATSGGAVYAASGTVSVSAGESTSPTITGNSAATAGGIYMGYTSGLTSSLTVSGGVLANNTASSAAADIYAASGVTLSLSDPTDVNNGVIFAADSRNAEIDGWYYDAADSDSGSTTNGRYDGSSNITTKYTSESSPELYLIAAHGKVYTITYNSNYPNNAENTTETESFPVSGTTATGTTKGSDTFTYDGYTFDGWNTEADGSGTSYAADTEITLESDITLYAQWKEVAAYTITYLPGCTKYTGSTVDSNTYSEGDTATVLKNGYSRAGYYFRYWVDENGTKYYPGDSITVSSDITLTAVWAYDYYDYDLPDDDDDDDDDEDEEEEEEETTTDDTVPELLNGDDHYAYIIGYPDGSVQPTGNLTRAEAATIMFRLLTDEARDTYLTDENTFEDVNPGDWYNTMISTLASIGILNGRSDTVFDPDAYITRAELAAICARFDDTTAEGIQIFTDIAGHWAEEEIGIAAALGWVEGDGDGTFRPDDYITRAETMTLVNRVLGREVEDEDDLLPGMNEWFDNLPTAWYYLAVQEATNSHVWEGKSGGYETWTEMLEDPDWTIYQ